MIKPQTFFSTPGILSQAHLRGSTTRVSHGLIMMVRFKLEYWRKRMCEAQEGSLRSRVKNHSGLPALYGGLAQTLKVFFLVIITFFHLRKNELFRVGVYVSKVKACDDFIENKAKTVDTTREHRTHPLISAAVTWWLRRLFKMSGGINFRLHERVTGHRPTEIRLSPALHRDIPFS